MEWRDVMKAFFKLFRELNGRYTNYNGHRTDGPSIERVTMEDGIMNDDVVCVTDSYGNKAWYLNGLCY